MISPSDISKKLKSDGKYWISFIGDSITSCEWVHPNWREVVEYVLKKEVEKEVDDWKLSSWGMRFFNFGYDGSTSKDIIDHLSVIKSVPSDLYIAMIGCNDYHKRMSLPEHKGNIETVLKSLESGGSKVVFSTNNYPVEKSAQDLYEPYVSVDREINAQNFINLFEKSKEFPAARIYTFKFGETDESEGIKPEDADFWHPNQLGNAYIAKVILKEIFSIDFDPELFWKTTLAGKKYPKY